MNRQIPDIRFYDFNFNLLHVENCFTSSSWNVKYNDIGSFEAHFDLESDTLTEIIDKNYLIAVQGEHAAVIIGKRLGDDLTIFGRTCNWLLTKRMIEAFSLIPATAADVFVSRKVSDAFYESAANKHIVETKPPLIGVPLITDERSDKCEIFKVVQECLEQVHLGHKLVFDAVNKKWIFQVLRGVKNPLIISTANRNAYEVTMESDLQNLCTEGWYKRNMVNMGDWNPETNQVTKDDITETASFRNNLPSNFGKYWKIAADYTGTRVGITGFKKGDFLICRDKTGELKISDNADSFWEKVPEESVNSGMLRWEGILSGGSESEAAAALAKARSTSNVQGKTAGIKFGKDYALGDVVTVQYQIGGYKKSAEKRIVGINLWCESGNIGEEPIFEDWNEA